MYVTVQTADQVFLDGVSAQILYSAASCQRRPHTCSVFCVRSPLAKVERIQHLSEVYVGKG